MTARRRRRLTYVALIALSVLCLVADTGLLGVQLALFVALGVGLSGALLGWLGVRLGAAAGMRTIAFGLFGGASAFSQQPLARRRV